MLKPNGIELKYRISEYRDDLGKGEEVYSKSKIVSCFGGSAITDETGYKQHAEGLAKRLAIAEISVITGGGSGIMYAANKGAYNVSPDFSYGFRVKSIEDEQHEKDEVICEENIRVYNTLSIRLLTLIGSCDVAVFFPGGYGTLEEMFSLLVRIRVGMMHRIPIYFYGRKFWEGLCDWMGVTVLPSGAINPCDLKLFSIEDDIEEMARKIIDGFKSEERLKE